MLHPSVPLGLCSGLPAHHAAGVGGGGWGGVEGVCCLWPHPHAVPLWLHWVQPWNCWNSWNHKQVVLPAGSHDGNQPAPVTLLVGAV